MEAMATGLPVVASRLSGIPELVTDGVSGLLVPAGDEAALADALATLAKDPTLRARLGAAGRETVLRDFDVDRNAALLADRIRRSLAAPESSAVPGHADTGRGVAAADSAA
jgi:glycosyltransferase involved in cell wall biosynthesis